MFIACITLVKSRPGQGLFCGYMGFSKFRNKELAIRANKAELAFVGIRLKIRWERSTNSAIAAESRESWKAEYALPPNLTC